MIYVTLIGQENLRAIQSAYPDAKKWIDSWIVTVLAAEWKSIVQVRMQYPSADGVKLADGAVVTVFNIAGNKYRMIATINYQQGIVSFRYFLTHAEYDKQKWKR